MVLCNQCRDIFTRESVEIFDAFEKGEPSLDADLHSGVKKEDAKRSINVHHEDLQNLAKSVLDSCYICTIVWRHFFRDTTPERLLISPSLSEAPSYVAKNGTYYQLCEPDRRSYSYSEDTVEVRIGLNLPLDQAIAETRNLVISPIDDEAATGLERHIKQAPSKSVYDGPTWSLVTDWIKECNKGHTECGTSLERSWAPTRLIDTMAPLPGIVRDDRDFEGAVAHITSESSSNESSATQPGLRVVETQEHMAPGEYITLSHRWQPNQSVMLKKSNIGQMKKELKYSDLLKTFREAIDFCRLLGIRYIWIDSLCIIQDDARDKIQEIEMMCEIYTHAFLNLSATNGDSTLLQPRNPELISPCIVEPRWSGRKRGQYVITDFRFWDDRIFRSETNKRAWIAQERWLSPRVLHFAFDQLVWECRRIEGCETFPWRLPKETRLNKHTRFKSQHKLSSHLNDDIYPKIRLHGVREGKETDHRLAHNDWDKVLETYGPAEVTDISDRLHGIFAIAKRFSTRLDDKFVVGLWRRSLPSDLLWVVRKMRRSNWMSNRVTETLTNSGSEAEIIKAGKPVFIASTRLKTYQAPSWSWLSVVGDIEPGANFVPTGSRRAMIGVLDISIEYQKSGAPISGIKSAALRLKGRLYPLALKASGSVYEQPLLYVRGTQQDALASEERYRELRKWSISASRRDLDQEETYEDLAEGCLLPVASVYERPPFRPEPKLDASQVVAEERNGYVKGLILLPTGRQGEYRRAGVFFGFREVAELMHQGFEEQKSEYRNLDESSHANSLDKAIYEGGKLGVFSII